VIGGAAERHTGVSQRDHADDVDCREAENDQRDEGHGS
jgi:hypothetical protein